MNATERQEAEKKLIEFVESLGFEPKAYIPHATYDEYVFVKQDGENILNLEVSFNGVGYRLATGYNNYLFFQNNKFELSWENLQFHIFHFNLDKQIDTDNEWDGE